MSYISHPFDDWFNQAARNRPRPDLMAHRPYLPERDYQKDTFYIPQRYMAVQQPLDPNRFENSPEYKEAYEAYKARLNREQEEVLQKVAESLKQSRYQEYLKLKEEFENERS